MIAPLRQPGALAPAAGVSLVFYYRIGCASATDPALQCAPQEAGDATMRRVGNKNDGSLLKHHARPA